MSEGYVYIAYGKHHITEAISSAIRLKEVDLEAHITVISDRDIKHSVFDRVQFKQNWDIRQQDSNKENIRQRGSLSRQNGKVDVLGKFLYKKNFYIDTDTWFVENPRSLFDSIGEFDICIASDPREIEIPGYPGMVPYNTGVVGYIANSRTEAFFKKYRKLYYTLPSDFTKYHPSRFRPEQPYFMLALKGSGCSVLNLNSLWNARYRFCTSFTGKVKIIHGPYPKIGWEELARRLNEGSENRAWKAQKGIE